MKQAMTSEERLLAHIRKKDKKEKPATPAGKADGPVEASPPVLGQPRTLKQVISVLLVLSGVLLAVLVARLAVLSGQNSGEFSLTLASPGDVEPEEYVWPAPKPFDFYKSELSSKDLFQAPWENGTAQSPNESAQQNEIPAGDLASQFIVVGIVIDNNPQVIVENAKSREVVFLSVGDEYQGAKLQSVSDEAAVFLYNGEERILTP